MSYENGMHSTDDDNDKYIIQKMMARIRRRGLLAQARQHIKQNEVNNMADLS